MMPPSTFWNAPLPCLIFSTPLLLRDMPLLICRPISKREARLARLRGLWLFWPTYSGQRKLVDVFGDVLNLQAASSSTMIVLPATILIGANQHDPSSAEWSAVVWALLWRIQLLRSCPFVLHADARAHLYAAERSQHWKTEPIAYLFRSIAMVVAQNIHV